MITVTEAFRKFRSRLELTQKEKDDASRRQREIRVVMNREFKIDQDFLTGSYARYTKTKPLKDVDIFCILHHDERIKYRTGKGPKAILDSTEEVLVDEYGVDNVRRQRRSVTVEFPGPYDDDRVMSFDVVPAFSRGAHYEIADEATSAGWTETDPRVHADRATEANQAFNGEWKGMVRMAKSWNQDHGKPVKPSFLLEVMALQILHPPFGGDYPYEFMSFFATAADRIHETWEDPAGLGPPISDSMTPDAVRNARTALTQASDMVREAIELARRGANGDALRKYREVFGDRFPLS
jgi:hypothetical protein